MGRMLLGFAIGVVLTSLVFVKLSADPDQFGLRARASDEVPIPAPIFPGPFDDDASEAIGSAREQEASEALTPTDNRAGLGLELAPQEATIQEQMAQARLALEEAQRTFEEVAAAAMNLEMTQLQSEPIVMLLPLPREFDWLTDGISTLRTNHERLQRESRDYLWAVPVEQQLSDFLYDRSELWQRYVAPTVTCAATLCEITVVGYGISEDVSRSDFLALMREFSQDPFYDNLFNRTDTHWFHNNQDGVATLIVSLTRKQEQRTQSTVATAFELR